MFAVRSTIAKADVLYYKCSPNPIILILISVTMFKACTDCHQRQYDKLKAKCSAMSREERLALAKRTNAAAMGMIVAGFGCFGGLVGGLWHQMGAGALGAGFGGACGLWFGLCGVFEEAKPS
eukprot:scaffold11368_cov74-Skeletonema_marinoi.AAC.7